MIKLLQAIVIVAVVFSLGQVSQSKTLDDNFLLSTVFIENKSTGQNGTGFLTFRQVGKSKYALYLISNKHILLPEPIIPNQTDDLYATATISVNTKISEDIVKVSRDIVLRDVMGNKFVKGHENPDVDVAGVNITKYFHDIFNIQDQKLFGISEKRFAGKEYLSKHFITIGDEALVIGYPLSLVEKGHVIPLARGVRIATKPEYNFRDLPAFLVDGTIIRGTSGSPVILPIRPYVWTEEKKIDITEVQENYIIGIVSSTMKDWEILIRQYSGSMVKQFSVIDDANLGIVFKKETVQEVMDLLGHVRWEEEAQNVQPEENPDNN